MMFADLEKLWMEKVAPEMREKLGEFDAKSTLSDALNLQSNQGDVFSAAGMAFLDPGFATEMLKPLVDHRLSRDSARADIAIHINATLGALPFPTALLFSP